MISLARNWPLLTPSSGQTFTDVPPSNPLYPFVETAYAYSALSGESAEICAARQVAYPCFLPNDPISRAQAAVITVRAFGWPLDTSGGPHFSDVPAANYAYSAVETCYNRGVVNGIGGGLFAPNANVTRAQLTRILYGALTLP
jgi:S-layer homology domain